MVSDRFRLIVLTVAATLAAAALLAALAGATVLYAGWYNVGATRQHFQIVHSVLERGMRESVKYHAREIAVPPLNSPAMIRRGALLYRDACAHCHGGPGVAPEDWGKSMQPVPGPLVEAAHKFKPNELYWVTRHGIRMSGMPAWEYHLSEDELWAVVAFVQVLPALSANSYREMTAAQMEAAP
jgi:mono/diheme cytochrome c family protein